MTEGEFARLVAWSQEMRRVHDRLREALGVAQAAVAEAGEALDAAADLLVYCHGFCVALSRHHLGEDRVLFPALALDRPDLAETLRALQQDHSMIAHLLGGLQSAVGRAADPGELERHLEGLAAIMESHFRFEERALLGVLDQLDLDADSTTVFGPL